MGGAELNTTVFPFILRGVTLCGIDTAWCPRAKRLDLWKHLATDWKLDGLADLSHTVDLEHIEEPVQRILAGQIVGRTVVQISK